ncbi:MAG: hypothetical protein FJ100_05935 [Deltaproteobacteria bacterium]|nr:hypothetical protein [Deltaproteobacteria bacterium]
MPARSSILFLATVAGLLGALPAPAQSGDDGPSRYRATVSFNPLLLLEPIFEATAEFRVLPMVGVAVIGGGGKRTETVNTGFGNATTTSNLILAGAQGSYYLSGNFDDGIHGGIEILYARKQIESAAGTVSSVAPKSSTSLGVFGGYKLSWPLSRQVGLTGLLQAGYGWVVQSSSQATVDSKAEPFLNVQAGASF